jgi:hypothetical protein
MANKQRVADPLSEKREILKESISRPPTREESEFVMKTYYLTPELVKKIKDYAYYRDMGKSEIVRTALEEFFTKELETK